MSNIDKVSKCGKLANDFTNQAQKQREGTMPSKTKAIKKAKNVNKQKKSQKEKAIQKKNKQRVDGKVGQGESQIKKTSLE